MPFEIAKMIVTVAAFPGEKGYKKFIPEMILNILLGWTALADGIQRIGQFKTPMSNEPGDKGGVGHTATAITPDINNKVGDLIFPEYPERVIKKPFKTIALSKRTQIHHGAVVDRVNSKQAHGIQPLFPLLFSRRLLRCRPECAGTATAGAIGRRIVNRDADVF
mgnify:CR=1 FL=1